MGKPFAYIFSDITFRHWKKYLNHISQIFRGLNTLSIIVRPTKMGARSLLSIDAREIFTYKFLSLAD